MAGRLAAGPGGRAGYRELELQCLTAVGLGGRAECLLAQPCWILLINLVR